MLISFLHANADVFAWKPIDMPTTGEDRALLECLTDRQTDQAKTPTIRARQEGGFRVEIKWLLAARFIKEVYHPEWLANPILVQKKNKEWRMCVDYTDLNKHCSLRPLRLTSRR